MVPRFIGILLAVVLASLVLSDGAFATASLASATEPRVERIVAISGEAGSLIGELVGPWPPEAVAGFEAAARILTRRVGGPVPLLVRADWTNLGEDTLGTGGSRLMLTDVPNGRPGVLYPLALANQVAGRRLAEGPDIEIEIASTASWDYTLDGSVAAETDGSLVQTVLHEIIHGMGFLGTTTWDDGEGYLGEEGEQVRNRTGWHRHGGSTHWHGVSRALEAEHLGQPDIFDSFVVTGAGRRITSFESPSQALGRVLTGESLFFDGAAAVAANGGRPVKLYAPPDWIEGSSYAHFDDDTYGRGPDALLTAIGEYAQSAELGPRTLGVLADLGWMVRPGR